MNNYPYYFGDSLLYTIVKSAPKPHSNYYGPYIRQRWGFGVCIARFEGVSATGLASFEVVNGRRKFMHMAYIVYVYV